MDRLTEACQKSKTPTCFGFEKISATLDLQTLRRNMLELPREFSGGKVRPSQPKTGNKSTSRGQYPEFRAGK